jgi:hypothetical protein
MKKAAFITFLIAQFSLQIQAQNWQIGKKVATINNEDASKTADKLLWVYLPSTSPK